MKKYLSTVAAAATLVSAIGLAYAQTNPAAEVQPADPNQTAAQQQANDVAAVNAGSTATPDWRTASDTAPTPAPADTSNSTSSSTDNSMNSTNSMTDNSATATDSSTNNNTSTDTSSNTSSTDNSSTNNNTTTDSSSSMITEPAPKADRN